MESLRRVYERLIQDPYEAHPFYTLKGDIPGDGFPSDCQDRTYYLGDLARKLGLKVELLWLVWYKKEITSHVCLVIEGHVYDPTWKVWKQPLQDYLENSGHDLKIKTPYFFRYIIP